MGGVATVVAAWSLDVLFGGAAGWGLQQLAIAGCGLAAAMSGAALASHLESSETTTWRGVLAAARSASVGRFAAVAAQLVMAVGVAQIFRVENPALYDKVLVLAAVGFPIHHLLPMRFRLPFFVVLSLTAVGYVFGMQSGMWLVALGLALIGICHLPVGFGVRVALLIAMACALAVGRAQLVPMPWSAAIWPVLGSMFMFRLIAYMYDLRHSRVRPTPAQALAYFFLLPNVAFPLFPVVDFTTFRRTYYDGDPYEIYQRGMQWIGRGIAHLLLYRLIYQSLMIAPTDVQTASDLVRYLVANLLLYLRVSGQFHLIVGVLHLFGFRLPETHHFFYLAASFTEFWRRINIYWKDFMQKVFYYPAYFALKKRGQGDAFALVLSSLAVFFATWFFHSYQWFWILGRWLMSWTDVLFWGILALLLVANALYEMKHGGTRAAQGKGPSRRAELQRALRAAGTFAVICVLWGMWTSPSVGEFASLWSVRVRPVDALFILAPLAAVFAVSLALGGARPGLAGARPGNTAFWRMARTTAAPLMLLAVIGAESVNRHFDVEVRAALQNFRRAGLSQADARILQQGYYENLTNFNRLNSQLWEVYAQRPVRERIIHETEAVRFTGDFLRSELRPSTFILFNDRPFSTNRWGMRDRDYERTAPSGTFRVAVLGASYVMGQGVGDDETFEALLERRLNAPSGGKQARGTRYELLNFAGPAYTPLQQVVVTERHVLEFQPDALFFFAHPSDFSLSATHVANMLIDGVDVFPDLLAAVPATEAARDNQLGRRLAPFGPDLVAWALRRIGDTSVKHGIRPVWIFLPTPADSVRDAASYERVAREAGFDTINLADVYSGRDETLLRVANWDHHPNVDGHRLIAERLAQELAARPELLRPPAVAPQQVRAASLGDGARRN